MPTINKWFYLLGNICLTNQLSFIPSNKYWNLFLRCAKRSLLLITMKQSKKTCVENNDRIKCHLWPAYFLNILGLLDASGDGLVSTKNSGNLTVVHFWCLNYGPRKSFVTFHCTFRNTVTNWRRSSMSTSIESCSMCRLSLSISNCTNSSFKAEMTSSIITTVTRPKQHFNSKTFYFPMCFIDNQLELGDIHFRQLWSCHSFFAHREAHLHRNVSMPTNFIMKKIHSLAHPHKNVVY